MFWLDVEVPEVDKTPQLDDSGRALVGQYRARWQRDIWQPYRRKQGQLRTIVLDTNLTTDDPTEIFATERLELVTNDKIFDQLFEVYLVGGLACLYDLYRHINAGPGAGGIAYFTRDFVNATIALFEEIAAEQLLIIEADVTALAQQETAECLATLRAAQACFEHHEHERYYELFVGRLARKGELPPNAKDRLYELFQTCFGLKQRIDRYQEEVEKRNRRDGGDADEIRRKRAADPVKKKQVDIYLVPQRALIAEYITASAEVERIFPAAAFVIDQLEIDVNDHLRMADYVNASSAAQRRSRNVERKYDSVIFSFLDQLATEMLVARQGLASAGIEQRVRDYLRKDLRRRVAELGGLHKYVLDFCLSMRPGIKAYTENFVRYGLFGVYFTDVERRNWAQANRVLGRPGALLRLAEQVKPEAFGLREVALFHYRADLDRRLTMTARDKSRSRQRWHYVEVVFTVVGLIAASVAIPLGGGAVGVPTGITLLLALIEVGLALVGIVLLVKGLTDLFTANLNAADDLRNQLIELGQNDPEALSELGAVVARNHELARAAGPDMLIEIVKLAAAHKLRIVAKALEIEAHIADVAFLQSADEIIEEEVELEPVR